MFDWVVNLFTTRTPSKPQSKPQPVAPPEPPVPEFVLAAQREAEVQRQQQARVNALAEQRRKDEQTRRNNVERDRLNKLQTECRAFLAQPAQLQQMERNLKHSIAGDPKQTRWDFTEVLRNMLNKASLLSCQRDNDDDHRYAMVAAVEALAPHFKAKGIVVELNETSTYKYEHTSIGGEGDTEHRSIETGTRRGVTIRW